jgi:hypothetical protein
MDAFVQQWANAAYTSVGFFWMALWAFALGYFISSLIQVFVTEERMQATMGDKGVKSIALGTFFGFISSSCSFSALATSKSLFQKGASFIASIAFLLASTNLVIELGIMISIFLGWQFVVGEYVGGILLILVSWLLVRLIRPTKLIKAARKRLDEAEHVEVDDTPLMRKLRSREAWSKVAMQYKMEWQMVWKDVTVGFTIAGIIAAFVPDQFFETLFIHSDVPQSELSFFTLLEHVVVGPFAAFLTFIGSMGNIPLAALLFDHGVSFAGVMAFIFSDLVVFPVLRINATYYGWRMSFFILFLLFTSLVVSALLLHYGLNWFDLLPSPNGEAITDQRFFAVDYSLFLNLGFLLLTGILAYLVVNSSHTHHGHAMAPKIPIIEQTLKVLAWVSYAWLGVGMVLKLSIG